MFAPCFKWIIHKLTHPNSRAKKVKIKFQNFNAWV